MKPNIIKSSLLTILFLVFSNSLIFGQEHHNSTKDLEVLEQHQSEEDKTFDPGDMINEHISDAHEFHIMDWKGKAISLPLPVILYTKEGVVAFFSSAFHHDQEGKVIVNKKGQDFVRIHNNIYYADKVEGNLHPEVLDFSLRPLDFSITKNIFSMILSVILLLLLFGSLARSYKKNDKAPKGLAGFLEPLVIFVRDDITVPNIGEKKADKYLPYLLTVFFFIWINNIIGLIPFFPFSSNLTGNIAFTMVLALFTFIITTFSGNKNYWSHILLPSVPKVLYPIMVPIEILGMFTKPFALMIRLFANIMAGHIIILSLVALIFIFKTAWISPVSGLFVIFMSTLEILVGALQAYVFTLLSALFIGQAIAEEH